MSPETTVPPRLSSCRSGNSLKRGLREPVTSRRERRSIFTTLQPFLGGWQTPRRGPRSHGSRLCWQVSIASFVVFEKLSMFYFSIFPKVGYSYPKKITAKTIERVATLQTSLHVTGLWPNDNTPRDTMLCKSVSSDSGNPSVSKTSFNGSSWGQVSTACIDLPWTFTASLTSSGTTVTAKL